MENYLVGNRVIKCRALGGLPRMRFDLSSYGDRRNYFIKDHKFNLSIKSLVAEEYAPVLGGGKLGVWIHTQPVSGLLWTWTPNNKWEPVREERLSIPLVKNNLAHIYDFAVKDPDPSQQIKCLGNIAQQDTVVNDTSLNNIKESYFETFNVEFDTRNFYFKHRTRKILL